MCTMGRMNTCIELLSNFALLKIEQKQYIAVGVLQFPPKVVLDPGRFVGLQWFVRET